MEILPLLTRLARARSEPPDRQIDQLVYELYGLTEEDIKIVEKPDESAGRRPEQGIASLIHYLSKEENSNEP
ncbi:MAG: hypothetical protein Q8Q12_16715 [bacterium]|nr:hypothetical protein [bacterium]